MIKCPFCYTKNEPETRFCVLCKSDIANAEPASESIVDVELVIDEPSQTEKAVSKDGLSLPAPVPSPLPETGAQAAQSVGTTKNRRGDSKPFKLIVLRGRQKDKEYILTPGRNLVGRNDAKPVDIDLEPQEDPSKVWVSRQHAVIYVTDGILIEDLNSSNGTYVNRERIFPGQKQNLKPGDLIQIGSVQLKLI